MFSYVYVSHSVHREGGVSQHAPGQRGRRLLMEGMCSGGVWTGGMYEQGVCGQGRGVCVRPSAHPSPTPS